MEIVVGFCNVHSSVQLTFVLGKIESTCSIVKLWNLFARPSVFCSRAPPLSHGSARLGISSYPLYQIHAFPMFLRLTYFLFE